MLRAAAMPRSEPSHPEMPDPMQLRLRRWQAVRTWARLIREAEALWRVDVRALHRLAAEELGSWCRRCRRGCAAASTAGWPGWGWPPGSPRGAGPRRIAGSAAAGSRERFGSGRSDPHPSPRDAAAPDPAGGRTTLAPTNAVGSPLAQPIARLRHTPVATISDGAPNHTISGV